MSLAEITTTPEATGCDSKHFQHVNALIERGVKEKVFPCATYMVLRHGMVIAQGAFGTAQPDAKAPTTCKAETLFDLASITKTFTATLLLQHVEEGRLTLNHELADLLPEAKDTPLAALTLKQCATHITGLPAWKPLYKSTRPALTEILATPLEKRPGSHYAYSDLGYILLGKVLERVSGKTLDVLVQERICKPLGMKQSGFRPTPSQNSHCAATANCPLREGKRLIGEVHDANAHSMGGVAGHAGMFAPAPELARYAIALEYPEVARHLQMKPLLGELTRKLIETNQLDPSIGSHSIGWFTPPNPFLPRGDVLSERTFGHTGFTGTLLMFDPENDLTLILLTNRVYFPRDAGESLKMRRLFANAVGGTIRP